MILADLVIRIPNLGPKAITQQGCVPHHVLNLIGPLFLGLVIQPITNKGKEGTIDPSHTKALQHPRFHNGMEPNPVVISQLKELGVIPILVLRKRLILDLSN